MNVNEFDAQLHIVKMQHLHGKFTLFHVKTLDKLNLHSETHEFTLHYSMKCFLIML